MDATPPIATGPKCTTSRNAGPSFRCNSLSAEITATISCGLVVGFAPIRKETIAEIFVNYAVLILDDLLATQNPRSEKKVQILAPHLAAERSKTANVRDKKPAENIFDLRARLLHDVRFVLFRNGDWLPDLENLIADCDLIAVAESNRVMNSPLVQKSSVAAAEINQPKLADIL